MKVWQRKNLDDAMKSIVNSMMTAFCVKGSMVTNDDTQQFLFIMFAVILAVFAVGLIGRCALRFVENEDKEVL